MSEEIAVTYRQKPKRVYAMGRVVCYCLECSGNRIWAIIYAKGEPVQYEDDFGRKHEYIGGTVEAVKG